MAASKPTPKKRWNNLSGAGGPAKPPTIGKDAALKVFTDYGYQPQNESELEYWANEPLQNKQVLLKNLMQRQQQDQKVKAAQDAQDAQTREDGTGFEVNTPQDGQVDETQPIYSPQSPGLGYFGNDVNTLYYIDKDNKTLRTINSKQALTDLATGDDGVDRTAEALKSVKQYDPTTDFGPGGALDGYIKLPADYSISEGKQFKELPVDINSLRKTYGKTPNDKDYGDAQFAVEGWLSLLQKSDKQLDPKLIESVSKDPIIMAKYANALAYGGYDQSDIYMDLYKQQQIANGNQTYNNFDSIDPMVDKANYQNTNDGLLSYNTMRPNVPAQIGNLYASQYTQTLKNLPAEFFQQTYPELYDKNNPQFQARMDDIHGAIYDALDSYTKATTEAEKAASDAQWKDVQNRISTMYGVQLKDNIIQAWNQVQTMEDQYADAGTPGLAIEKAADAEKLMGDQAQSVTDLQNYQQKMYERAQMTSFASPEEINQMNQQDKAKGLPIEQWRSSQMGLLPPGGSKDYTSWLSDWRSRNNNADANAMSDAQVKDKYFTPYYDDYGNLYSTAYKTAIGNAFTTKYGTDPYGLPSQSLEAFKQSQMQAQADIELQNKEGYKDPMAGSQAQNVPGYSAYDKLSSSVANAPATANNTLNAATPAAKYGTLSSMNFGPTGPATPATVTTPAVTTPTPAKVTPAPIVAPKIPTGYEKISSPSELGNYTGVKKLDNTVDLYGIKKVTQPKLPKPLTSNPFNTANQGMSIRPSYNPSSVINPFNSNLF